jgi:hypothetical protein
MDAKPRPKVWIDALLPLGLDAMPNLLYINEPLDLTATTPLSRREGADGVGASDIRA